VLPQNIEAEQQLLGAILTNNDIYDRIAALVKAEHFFDPVHPASSKSPPPASRRMRWPRRSRSRPFWKMTKGCGTRGAVLSGAAGGGGDFGLCGARLCADDL
jgi:hypothetical protein